MLTEVQMADHFIRFLTKFFKIFPEYERDDVNSNQYTPKLFNEADPLFLDLHIWRVLCRAAYPIYCPGYYQP